jgi:hypothetical protein
MENTNSAPVSVRMLAGWSGPPACHAASRSGILRAILKKFMPAIDTVLLVFLGLAISYFLDAVFEISPRLAAWIDRELSD